ncbi:MULTISPECIES: hypothetical protein [unclassified Janthinobacterium]|uniref:hypothetical protein n=1 Tax=unclassified Janthinobacterium TaxID=2610881 RepID=UPI0012FCFE25|nr:MULTISPECIES: hypothetical protein [unclassified Janthinobacterium]
MLANTKTIAASLLGLAFGSLSLSAQAAAGASARASMGQFGYQLIDMNPTDGIAPSITFTSYSSAGDSWADSGDGRTTLGATGVFEEKGSASTEAAHAGTAAPPRRWCPITISADLPRVSSTARNSPCRRTRWLFFRRLQPERRLRPANERGPAVGLQ